jgi:hypothetical protein
MPAWTGRDETVAAAAAAAAAAAYIAITQQCRYISI